MFTSKKILAFILLLTIAAPLLFFASFLLQQQLIENEMEERLENASLQTIVADQAAVQWIKKGKEVIIEGKLFDVKSFRYSGKQIILTGLFDEDEDHLNSKLNTILAQTNEDPSSPLDDLTESFFSTPINTNNPDFTIAADWFYITTKYRKFSEVIPVAPSLPYILPPKA
jgi:hypothetical protein